MPILWSASNGRGGGTYAVGSGGEGGRARDPALRSRLEALQEPVGTHRLGSQCLGSPPELAIRRDECDPLFGRPSGDVDEQVVAAADGVFDRDAPGLARLHALASLALEDHDHRSGQSFRGNGRSYLIHECSGRPCSVPPPAAGSGSDHIGRVDQNHCSSLTEEITGPTHARGELRTTRLASPPPRWSDAGRHTAGCSPVARRPARMPSAGRRLIANQPGISWCH